MKKLMLFIALKAVEVGLVVFTPYYVGKFVHTWSGNFFCFHYNDPPTCEPFWAIGLASLLLAIVLGALLALNWYWAGLLKNKYFSR